MKKCACVIGMLFAVLPIRHTFTQGMLTPPGAPAPTMKTLDQIESRTIVNSTNTPGNSSYSFVISQPGSYYLTGNFTAVDSKGGVSITASNVTLDLNGYTLSGGSTSARAGITTASSSVNNVTIRSGKVISWATDGISTPNSARVSIEYIQADGNGGTIQGNGSGINVGTLSHVKLCSVSNNSDSGIRGGGADNTVSDCESVGNQDFGVLLFSGIVTRCNSYRDGIRINSDGVVSDCVASYGSISVIGSVGNAISVIGCTVSFSATDGITTGNNATIERCSVESGACVGINTGNNATLDHCSIASCAGVGINSGTGSTLRGCSVHGNSSHGFNVGDSCTLVDCTATASTGSAANGFNCGNGVTLSNCTAAANPGNGIVLGNHSTAQNCVASGNTGDGITVTVECNVLNCNACANGGNGIHLLGGTNSNNRVDGNNASNNTAIGILQHGGPDLIVRNLARSNGSGTNYSPSSGTSVGPIGTPNTATSPWANFQ